MAGARCIAAMYIFCKRSPSSRIAKSGRRSGLTATYAKATSSAGCSTIRQSNRVGPIYGAAVVAREVEAAQPHHINVAGALGLAPVKDLAGLVDRRKEGPVQDLLVRETGLLDAHLGSLLLRRATSGSGCGVWSPPRSGTSRRRYFCPRHIGPTEPSVSDLLPM